MKVRIYTKEEIKEAFYEYLMETKQTEADDWNKLSVDDIETLENRHFNIFYNELKRWTPKRKIEIE